MYLQRSTATIVETHAFNPEGKPYKKLYKGKSVRGKEQRENSHEEAKYGWSIS